ncbi:MAG: hypothetical protein FH751_02425 [Firmicutes bacterium]|nr:hypothetical protein [Bacillota bacterium]
MKSRIFLLLGIGIIILIVIVYISINEELNNNVSHRKATKMKQEVSNNKDKYITVGAIDCDYKTIKEALASKNEKRKIIYIMDKIHTEPGIEISKDITICGFGKENTIIQAADKLKLSEDRVFLINKKANVKLKGLTIRHGKITEIPRGGGGIKNLGKLSIEACEISLNKATYGVGINNKGYLNINRSVIAKNIGIKRPIKDALHGVDCGGSGGGLNVERGSEVVIRNSLIIDNKSVANGGGIHVNCEGKAKLINCTVARNKGGKQGGGISVRGDLELIHCTITENDSRVKLGCGVFVMGKIDMFATLIVNNKYSNFALGEGAGYYGKGILDKSEYNFIGDINNSNLKGVTYFISEDIKLYPLQDNGGSTKTYALDFNSSAVDVIPEDESFVTVDQRGVIRDKGPSDIGAYEVEKTISKRIKNFIRDINPLY